MKTKIKLKPHRPSPKETVVSNLQMHNTTERNMNKEGSVTPPNEHNNTLILNCEEKESNKTLSKIQCCINQIRYRVENLSSRLVEAEKKNT